MYMSIYNIQIIDMKYNIRDRIGGLKRLARYRFENPNQPLQTLSCFRLLQNWILNSLKNNQLRGKPTSPIF